ncbi:uncharacterized protein LOC143179958 [Calliopsis andreniformis]|uniref:uncharacterized protein LOC143179958 n=1 Tax=Calliopsis andreniformis TaxID=337506 RepID=UPI003FCEC144
MSGSGFRGRGFGPRGARTNGPANSFNGPRFSHPNFNHSRPPHRLSGPEKWVEGPSFPPWQQNKNFGPRPHFRGNFRPNGRNRAPSGRGIVRFSGPGRPPAPQFCTNFIRNLGPRQPLLQEEQIVEEEKSVLATQLPLPGSEEERQQKITETADKLKQKLSSITEEDLTNFWEDDLSLLPHNTIEEESRSKAIPELRHEPPELDLTFTDFRDIGRVDCNNSKFDTIEDTPDNDVLITFENEVTGPHINEDNDIAIVNANTDECLNILNSIEDNNALDETNILLGDDNCQQEAFHEFSDAECNLESLQLQCNNLIESEIPLNSNDIEENLVSNLEENITNLTSIQPDAINEKSLDLNDIQGTSIQEPVFNDQDVLQIDFTEDQSLSQGDVQDTNTEIIQDINLNIHQDGQVETESQQIQDILQTDSQQIQDNLQVDSQQIQDNLQEDSQQIQDNIQENLQQIQNNLQADPEQIQNNLPSDSEQIQDNLQPKVPQEDVSQISMDVSDSHQNNTFEPLSSDETIQINTTCDSQSVTCSSYNEVHKLNNDKQLNTPPHFQPRGFNIPPRFAPRIPGPRCRWTFQQNGKNTFFRGSQRLPFHGTRMPPPRHVAPFTSTDIVSVPFDPRAPPPFTHNIPVSSHDTQHPPLVPFSSNELPPSFDPSEPPPNMRSTAIIESPDKQEVTQTISSSESRNQTRNVPPNSMEIMQPPPAFDPRGPPPTIPIIIAENLPEFNPQQPPPKIHKRDETLQPPPIFDPRLSSQERSKLIAPLSTSGSHMMGINLTEPSQMPGFNMAPVAANFSQPPPISIPSHQAFMPNLQVNFPSVLPQANAGQLMVGEFTLPPPPMTITNVPPPPPEDSALEKDPVNNQNINMDDDGLEDMQEAMEFAKQIMNMTEEMKNNQSTLSELPEVPLKPPEIPVPNVETPCLISEDDVSVTTVRKQKRRESKTKKSIENVICGPELEKHEENEVIENEQNQDKNSEEPLLTGDQIRPKVVFNLNSKTKVIHKPEEWHRPSTHISDIRETSQQIVTQNSHKEKTQSKRHSSESRRNNTSQNKKQQKERNSKPDQTRYTEIINTSGPEKFNDTYRHHNYVRDIEKLHSHSSNEPRQKNQKSKNETKKVEAVTSESLWKNRVISRFLKMSKNDICNMVNNSSLRKFDIAMKHLVKERRSSLSLEMRNTEDEKMKEYDREEFMNQLNAMLDSGAVVGITDLPTEFIHHLSEVLQLEPMPFEPESSERENTVINEIQSKDQIDAPKIHTSEQHPKNEVKNPQPLSDFAGCENSCNERREPKTLHKKEEPVSYPLNTEFNLNITREDTNSSKKSLINKPNPETENTYKKQQPLFNEADLDDILLQVTERTKHPRSTNTTRHKSIDIRKGPPLIPAVTEVYNCNAFPQIPTKTAADLDDIFSAGIARAKSLSKSIDSEHSRTRKSTSEDRNTFRSERYDRWSRKEREEPDTFRNLTKEEWEAKYGPNATTSSAIRKTASTSVENLSKDNRNYLSQRYCSSDSPMRNLSISPLTREAPGPNLERCVNRYNDVEESRRTERSESSSDTSTTSSSDSDEETVSPNVTKLLKVIKEKEKIAKKKSLNETIRDEVAAEIEKKWKEKSKHKERRSRKREKRKRDKRDKRKKEKRKRRKRNSHSDTSKSSEQSEEFRLLTEDEIKKEVVVKQEPVSTFDESISLNSGTSNNNTVSVSTNKQVEPILQIESQSTQEEKQQAPVVICNKTSPHVKSKPTIISITTQPKTKAQLKQMPESNDLGQTQIMEKSVEVVKNSINSAMSINNERIKGQAEKSTDSQIKEATIEKTNIVLSTNNPLPQTNTSTDTLSQTSMCVNTSVSQVSTSTNDSLLQINMLTNNLLPETIVSTNNSLLQTNVSTNNSLPQTNLSTNSSLPQMNVPVNDSLPQINVSSSIAEPSPAEVPSDDTTNTMSLASNVTNTVPVTNTSTQSIVQKTETSTSSTESKSGYRKIDIKAYKERALQRRLKEEAKLKETASNSVPVSQEPQHVISTNKVANETEKPEIIKELNTVETDTTKLKDPRLAKNRPTRTFWDDSMKEVKEKSTSKKENQNTESLEKGKEHSVLVTLESSSEWIGFKIKDKNTTHKSDSDSNSLTDSVKSKDRKSDTKSLSQEKLHKTEETRVKSESKIESEEKKSKKPPVTLESNKFKNIRSEGSKELKLKKEKAKKSSEKKKKSTKSKSPLITETHSKHLHEKMVEETQKPVTVNMDTTNQTDTEKTDSCDVPEPNQNEQVKENLTESTLEAENIIMDDIVKNEINKGQVNAQVTAEENNENDTNSNKEAKVPENQAIVNQVTTEIPDNQQENKIGEVDIGSEQNLLNSQIKENNIQETEENNSKNSELNVTSSESTITEKLNNEGTEKETLFFNQTSSDSVKKTVTEDKPEEAPILCTIDSHQVNQDSCSSEKEVCLDNEENIQKSETVSSSTPHAEINPETVKNIDTNLGTKANSVEESEVRSPDSSGSPFKGFHVESIEEDICQASQLINIETISKGAKNDESEKPEKLLEICTDNNTDKELFIETKETGEIASTCPLTEEQKNNMETVIEETDHGNSDLISYDESNTNIIETENKNLVEESQTCHSDMTQEDVPPVINLDSQDTFDEDGEPFIVLDEYIDDTDTKSMEKLSALDLDLEDCIARDTELFSNKSSQEVTNSTENIKSSNFNAIHFNELKEAFNNDNITSTEEKMTKSNSINNVSSTDIVVYKGDNINTASSEVNTEPEITEHAESVPIIPEVPIESSQTDIPFIKDIAQKLEASQDSVCTDMKKTEQRVLPIEHNPESLEIICSETEINSSAPIKTASSKIENLSPIIASTSESKIESSRLNEDIDNHEEENNKEADERLEDKLIFHEKESMDEKVCPSSTVEHKSKESYELSEDRQKKISNKSNQKENDETLHKIKSKSKMKHKQRKKRSVSKALVEETIQSDTVKVKYPNTKEGIMARMIEIDVEIHKLMTEKMTLYQMLTNDALPADINLQQNNALYEKKEIETAVVRPRTPSALMSQLIQNIETSPVTNQCGKTTENLPLKESTTNPVQSNKSKVSKHEHHTEKKTSYVSSRSSDNEEATHHTMDSKSSICKKRKRSKWAIKWKETDTMNNSEPETVMEEKQTNDGTKSILKKIHTKQKATEHSTDQTLMSDKSQGNSNEISAHIDKKNSIYNNETGTLCTQIHKKTVELVESQGYLNDSDKSKVLRQDNETTSQKDGDDTLEALNDTDTASSVLKPPDSRTPERSSIYSDDSTWDSLPQNTSIDDQKKSTTGLALLEETYKKEIAQTRKRIEIRKKKRKRIRGLSPTVSTLTPEEEELPLSDLYAKKLYQKKKSQSSTEETEKGKDEPHHWTNIDEIINAVAENRTEELYTERSEGHPANVDNQSNVPDLNATSVNKEQVSDLKANSKPISLGRDEKTTDSPTVQNIEEASVEQSVSSKDITSTEDTNDVSNDLQLTSMCPSKSQDIPDAKKQEQNVADAEPQNLNDLPETSINIEENVPRDDKQQISENNNIEINQSISAENSELCTAERGGINSTCNDQDILNIPETNTDSEKIEQENTDGHTKESNLQEKSVPLEENVPTDVQEVLEPKSLEESRDTPVDPHSPKTTTTTSEITTSILDENINIEAENQNKETYKNTSLTLEAVERFNERQKEEYSLSVKEHRGSHRRRESERSNKSSIEENNSNHTSVSSTSRNAETSKNEELGKKMAKRKRGSSRTPLRRSSRYTEEVVKRIKVEVDANPQIVEQESQEKNVQMQFPNISPTLCNEEAENTLTNTKRSRSVQKAGNRKRSMPPDMENLSGQLTSNYESLKDIKRCKHMVPTIMNCEVRLIDSKHTILKPNVDPNVLRKYGISTINSYLSSNSVQTDHPLSPVQSTSAKDLPSACAKQPSKSVKKLNDVTRSLGDQLSSTKVRKGPKFSKMNLFTDKEKCTDPDVQVMPVLTREQVVVDISHDCEKPDIEIVEEKMIVTKNQQHNDSGSTLTVIETKDDKELPRTQYTVHKGPILDIKVFENSFLAASEDGRIYRYSQASNGILNIYKGHQAAVTCLYVYNASGTDINKEWMFSGSLDGTLRCYNITTGVQVRDTVDIGSPIQCMDEAWGIIFIGTKSGHVLRYHMKSGVMKGNSIQFSDKSVLALKATNEGPRKVLIVASRSQPITIRDAQTGLFLRTICGQKSHTVYSLMRDHNLIYCGTSSTSILVFDFTNGEQMMQYDAGVGIVCMRLYKQLLFAGCYDGNIYVFDTKDYRLVCSIAGPGNMLLSMEVIDNKIIAGSKDKRLQSWQMSRQVRSLL